LASDSRNGSSGQPPLKLVHDNARPGDEIPAVWAAWQQQRQARGAAAEALRADIEALRDELGTVLEQFGALCEAVVALEAASGTEPKVEPRGRWARIRALFGRP